jgi:molecular chaperone DnaK
VISSFILRSLLHDAQRVLGPVSKAVITVPAYFDETRRRATLLGLDAAVTTDFQRENRLPEDDLDLWLHFVGQEAKRTGRG